MRRRQFNRLIGRGPSGMGTSALSPVTFVSAEVTSLGTQVAITFSRPVTLIGSVGDIFLSGSFGVYAGSSIASNVGNVVTVVLGGSTVYDDDTSLTLDIPADVFQDSSGNPFDIVGATVANGSTVPYPSGALFIAIANPTYTASDASHVVPCGAGDAIRWWKDAVSGVWYEQATSGNRMILRANGSKWYAEGGGTRVHSFATPSMPGSAGMVASRFAGQTTGVMWTPISLNGGEYARFQFDGDRYAANFRNVRADNFGTPPPNDTSPHTYTQVSGADYRVYFDSTLVGTTTVSWLAPSQCLIGQGGVVGSQNVAAAAVYPDGTNRADVEAWIARYM